MPSDTPKEFPQNFVDRVHAYLKQNQDQYGEKYHQYFMATTPKKTTALLGAFDDTPRSFQSLCCIAGKTCGLISLTYSNKTLPALLEAVKKAYEACTPDQQNTISQLFGNKTKENITEDDLLEIGLYEKVDCQPKSPGELLLRHENLKTIYAGEHQRINRQEDSLPDHIHYWVIIEKSYSQFDEQLLLQSELCKKKYTITTEKSNDCGKIWIITHSNKKCISQPNTENAGLYFLSQLEKTLRDYYDARNNAFYKNFGKKSEASTKLYNTLFDIIINDDKDISGKINAIIMTLNDELTLIQKQIADNQFKTRRLINILTESGFMCPDVLRSAESTENQLIERVQSDPIGTQDAHPAMQR